MILSLKWQTIMTVIVEFPIVIVDLVVARKPSHDHEFGSFQTNAKGVLEV